MTVGGMTCSEGDYLSIDGTRGKFSPAKCTTAPSEIVQVAGRRIARRKEERDLSATTRS